MGSKSMLVRIVAAATAGLAFVLLARAAGPAAGPPRIVVDGTILRVTDGTRIVEGIDLVGAELTLGVDGRPVHARIAAVTADPTVAAGDVLLYDVRLIGEDGLETPLCRPDAAGRTLGFPLAGRTDQTGALIPTGDGAFEFVCASGAQGKCVRFGYMPWRTAPDGTSMRPFYDACVRMVRADYCGDGRSFTRDGTLIGFADSAGVTTIEPADIAREGLAFEAAWSPDGAVCIARPRLDDVDSPESLARTCPRLASRIGASVCEPGTPGGLLVNYSRPASSTDGSRSIPAVSNAAQ
jgi:hypothetical protein